MHPLFRLLPWLAFFAGTHLMTAADFSDLRARAEAAFAEGSYAQAYALYRTAPTNLPPADARWVAFRRPDSQWRAQGNNLRGEETEAAIRLLKQGFPDETLAAERDTVWAAAQEALGDLEDRRQDSRDKVKRHYGLALDWWAGQSELETARGRYLQIVTKLAHGGVARNRRYQTHLDLDAELLNRAVSLARSPGEIAQFRSLRARHEAQLGPPDPRALYQVEDDFLAALQPGRNTPGYDEALYAYAEWLEQRGRLVLPATGEWNREGDPGRALERFRQLTTEFTAAQSPFWEMARQRAEQIMAVSLDVAVDGAFLPASEIQFTAAWRNLDRIEWTLRAVELPRDLAFKATDQGVGNWLGAITAQGAPVQQGRLDVPAGVRHEAQRTNVILSAKLPVGAYLLELRSGGKTARELVLVSDVVLTLKTGGHQTLAWLTDVTTGQPVGDAAVALWHWRTVPNEKPQWTRQDRTTDASGIAAFEVKGDSGPIFVSAAVRGAAGSRQAFVPSWINPTAGEAQGWRVYVFTDRPAYRPLETVHWKLTARRQEAGAYRTPAGVPLYYEITDPRGGKVTNGVARLNAFGSAWGDFTLGSEPVLGEYRLNLYTEVQHRNLVGSATLFRSEEYKLPEFEVTVRMPEEDAPGGGKRPRTLKLGEPVEIQVQADYYAGGAVADAEVELLVHQSPWVMHSPWAREYPWYFEDSSQPGGRGWWHREDPIIRRETLKTDATGRATYRLETDPAGQDVEFRVEARVRDSSRREVNGEGTMRVTRQRYFASARSLNQVRQPGSRTSIEFRTQDANGRPVSVTGTVTISRERWTEVWVDPTGKVLEGAALDERRNRASSWPPPGEPGWKLRKRGYDVEELRKETVTTGAAGTGELVFTPDTVGYYRFRWSSPGNATAPKPTDPRPQPFEPPVTTETVLWACATATADVGYRSEGLQILLDADTARVGARLPVMVVTSAPDRWVLFTTEVGDGMEHEVLHLTGTVKLVEIPLTDRHVPNFFLGALSVRDRQLLTDQKEVVVPATKNFLTVDVTPDRPGYGPREAGSLLVTTRDAEGRPVSAEVAVSLADDSVYAIQAELAGDPRPFFFGQKRGNATRFESGFNHRRYLRWVRGPQARAGQLYPEGAMVSGDQAVDGLEVTSMDGSALGGTESTSPVMAARYGLSMKTRNRSGSANMAAPAPAMAMSAGGMVLQDAAVSRSAMASPAPAAPGAGAGAASQVVVRSDFRATAFWQPDVKTGADGQARVPVQYPDSLTRWRATVRAVGPETQVGWATTNTQTRSPLMVRLQAPRFFVVGDVAVISSVIRNQSEQPVRVRSTLEASGVTVSGGYANGEFVKEKRTEGLITIPALGEYTDNWAVSVPRSGPVKLKVIALAEPRAGDVAALSDAMEREYTAYPRGIDKFLAVTGKLPTGAAETEFVLELPAARQPGTTRLSVNLKPSLAVTMLDALPYLADYPYGCTEQTLSRFLPAVVVRKTLRDLGLNADAAMAHAFGGIHTNTQGQVAPRLGAKQDLGKLDDMVRQGLERLGDFQHADGSWGWWKEGASDPWMTAYVVWGWRLARSAGVDVNPERLQRGLRWLEANVLKATLSPGTQVWMLHALVVDRPRTEAVSATQAKVFKTLWDGRDALTSYERALLLLSAHALGKATEAQTLLRNLENGVIRGDAANSALLPGQIRAPQPLAHWGTESGWWRWTDGAVESTATTLRAILAVDPKHPLAEPTLNWLLKNRRGAQWSNTRDTALSLLSLTEHLRVSGEGQGDLSAVVDVNGHELGRLDWRGKPLWEFASELSVPAEWLTERNVVRLRRTNGTGPLYCAVKAEFFSTEQPIAPAGNELFVRREYFKRVGRPTLLKGLVYDRLPLRPGETVKSGDRVEAVLTVETKNDYEYLLFEDLKPAGFEAALLSSGGWLSARQLRDGRAVDSTGQRDPSEYLGRTQSVYPEWRDRKAALFADRLPAGFWELRYEFRAEVPGDFSALPVMAHAMYVPDLRANSAELPVRVRD